MSIHRPDAGRGMFAAMLEDPVIAVLAFVACDAPNDTDSGRAGSQSPRQNLKVSMDAGHVHVFREVAVAFTVRDMDRCANPADLTSCEGVFGLDVTAFHKAAGSASEQKLAPGKLEDAGADATCGTAPTRIRCGGGEECRFAVAR